MSFSSSFRFFIICIPALLVMSCSGTDDPPRSDDDMGGKDTEKDKDIESLRFFDDYIIPEGFKYDHVEVGGWSDLSYDGSYFYAVSDQASDPRIYKFSIDFEENEIDTLRFKESIPIQRTSFDTLVFDLEGLIFDSDRGRYIVSSEGNIEAGKNGFVVELDKEGQLLDFYDLPDYFNASYEGGPQNNGVFEGLCSGVDGRGIWVSTELPLKMDVSPDASEVENPVIRVTRFDKENKEPTEQFLYPLGGFEGHNTVLMEGVSAILEYQPDQFLVLERSFVVGNQNIGFQARLFAVDAAEATNTVNTENVQSKIDKEIIPAKKKLLLDFQDLKEELTGNRVDNLEGLALGPVLPTGNQSLVVISDNNFNSVIEQLNQVIVLEIIK